MPGTAASPVAFARISRRALLSMAASVAALSLGNLPVFAATPGIRPEIARFLALSRKLTAYQDLDPVTAARIFDALAADTPDNGAVYEQLGSLSEDAGDARDLRARAESAGLLDALTATLSAWYTGTVAGTNATTVVAYREALMYRPVEDGLTVPTYCNKGPMWWQDTLPPGVTRTPINSPEVL